jgi:hypothetical protein
MIRRDAAYRGKHSWLSSLSAESFMGFVLTVGRQCGSA